MMWLIRGTQVSARFSRGLGLITVTAIVLTIYMEMLFGSEAIHAEEWITLGIIGVLGFLIWSVGLGILFLLHGRR